MNNCGLPVHLFRFSLELTSAPRWRSHCILLLIIVRSFLALENQKQKVSGTGSTLLKMLGGLSYPRTSEVTVLASGDRINVPVALICEVC